MSDNEFGPVDLTGLEPDKLIAKKWEDRLEEAKQYFNPTQGAEITEYISTLGRWLIAELEDCKSASSAKSALIKAQAKVAIGRLRELRQNEAEIDHQRKWVVKKARACNDALVLPR